jgi:hypothetical protein
MNLKHIKIEPLSDEYDCDTCGTSWATGYEVTFPDGSSFTLEPQAHCLGVMIGQKLNLWKKS